MHSSFAQQSPSGALESNLNPPFHFPHIVINFRFIQLCNLDVFHSSKTKLKERNNSVFGIAIEKHGWITTFGVHVCIFI